MTEYWQKFLLPQLLAEKIIGFYVAEEGVRSTFGSLRTPSNDQ
jgi:hypothetical protein